MGDHFVLPVDRLLTESSLEAVVRSNNQLHHASSSVPAHMKTSFPSDRMDMNVGSPTGKLAECRICHDEDEESKMEMPCSCRGSLKYAHRKCVQRWCNEKGDTICEICHQQFKPGYASPPPLFHCDGISMNLRGDWEVSTSDPNNNQLIATGSVDENFLGSSFDEYPQLTARSLICCRIVALIFAVLVVLRHTIPFVMYGSNEYSISLLTLLILRTIGILLPIYIMAKACTAIQHRRNRLGSPISPIVWPDGENELPPQHQQQLHFVHVP